MSREAPSLPLHVFLDPNLVFAVAIRVLNAQQDSWGKEKKISDFISKFSKLSPRKVYSNF